MDHSGFENFYPLVIRKIIGAIKLDVGKVFPFSRKLLVFPCQIEKIEIHREIEKISLSPCDFSMDHSYFNNFYLHIIGKIIGAIKPDL